MEYLTIWLTILFTALYIIMGIGHHKLAGGEIPMMMNVFLWPIGMVVAAFAL
jgi:hypothetical protein